MLRNSEGALRGRQESRPRSVAAIRHLRRHDTLKAIAFRELSVYEQLGRVNPQRVTRQSGQALDVKWRACFGIVGDSGNVVSSKNKDVATMWFDKIIGKLVDEHLIARIHRAAGYNIAPSIS